MERLETIARTRDFVRGRRGAGLSIAFVPTMGALHRGHGACIEVARSLGDVVAVSIFVNPTQFGPGEDLARYPRPLSRDLELCEGWGVDAVFLPDTNEMYPVEQDVWVEVGRASKPLCGRTREGHFRGVATVVLKLLNIVQPDVAVFGQKDAQQALVIRTMVDELDLPVKIALSPTVRESDGLALSSRNSYLSKVERERAASIYRSLLHAKDVLSKGERDPARVTSEARRVMEGQGVADVEYVELLDARDLSAPRRAEGKLILAVAAKVGNTRLIDNIVLDIAGDKVQEALLF